MVYKGAIQLNAGLKNMVTLTSQTNPSILWKRVKIKSCLNCSVRLLERKNTRLEKELELKDIKVEFFDMMIDIAEKEYNIAIRKNTFPEQSLNIKKKNP